MTESEPTPEHDIEALFQAHWQRQADKIDPRPLHDRICATLRVQSATPVSTLPLPTRKHGARPRFNRRLAWALSAAAAILAAFFGGLHFAPVHASPQALVRQAQEIHRLPLDRCYLVEIRR